MKAHEVFDGLKRIGRIKRLKNGCAMDSSLLLLKYDPVDSIHRTVGGPDKPSRHLHKCKFSTKDHGYYMVVSG